MIGFRPKASPRFLGFTIALGLVMACIGMVAAASDNVDALPGANILRFVLGTAFAVALLLLSARFLPRLSRVAGARASSLKVVASLAVGQRERVVVVQVGDQQIMLGVAPGRVGMLHELPEKIGVQDAAPQPAGNSSGSAWVARVLGKTA